MTQLIDETAHDVITGIMFDDVSIGSYDPFFSPITFLTYLVKSEIKRVCFSDRSNDMNVYKREVNNITDFLKSRAQPEMGGGAFSCILYMRSQKADILIQSGRDAYERA